MMDRTTILLCFFLAGLLLILFYMPSSRQSQQQLQLDSAVGQQLKRFQSTIKKFVNSMGDMEQRLDKLEVNIRNIQKKQESVQNIQKKQESVSSQIIKRRKQEPVNHDAENEKEVSAPDFVGEIKRDDKCFDSVEHGLDGAIEIHDMNLPESQAMLPDFIQCKGSHSLPEDTRQYIGVHLSAIDLLHNKQGGISSETNEQEFQMQGNSIRHKDWCLRVEKAEEGQSVLLDNCDDTNSLQKWQYQDKLIKSAEMNFCMRNKFGRGVVTLAECSTEDETQKWDLEKKYGT